MSAREEAASRAKDFLLLIRLTFLSEAQPSVRKRLTLFCKHVLQTFETPVQEVPIEIGFYGKGTHTIITFVRGGYVVGGCVPSLGHLDKRRCNIMEPDA